MKIDKSEVEHRIDRFKETARTAGVKLTHQRLEIYREIASSLDHPDAETVYRSVRKRISTVSLDTVYRTLWTLNDLGLITTLGARHERVRFDANLEHHHHFVCIRCGLARDFIDSELDALPLPSVASSFGNVLATHVEIRGVCLKCSNKKSDSPGRRKISATERSGKE